MKGTLLAAHHARVTPATAAQSAGCHDPAIVIIPTESEGGIIRSTFSKFRARSDRRGKMIHICINIRILHITLQDEK